VATVFYEHATAELATLTNTFSAGSPSVPTDPTTVSLTIVSPAGVSTTYTYGAAQITRTGTGVYTKDIACTEDGIWQYVWVGTGTASDVVVGTWSVFNTDLQRNYCTLEELKSRLGIPATDTQDDFELKLAVESASRWIEDHCDRQQFWRGTDTRTFTSCDPYAVDVDDLVSVTTLKTDSAGDGTFETTWAATDYQLRPPNAAGKGRPYTQVAAVGGTLTFPYLYEGQTARTDRVQIVGVFGWPALPAAVKQACLIVAAEHVKLKDAPFGVAGFGDFGAVRVRQSPQAAALLASFCKYPFQVA
jgi:hypothetical protein